MFHKLNTSEHISIPNFRRGKTEESRPCQYVQSCCAFQIPSRRISKTGFQSVIIGVIARKEQVLALEGGSSPIVQVQIS